MPMFTSRHYVSIADAIAVLASDSGSSLFTRLELDRFAFALADRFEHDNARFNRDRFLSACGSSTLRTKTARRKDRI